MTIDDIKNLLNQNPKNTPLSPTAPPVKKDMKTQPGAKSTDPHTGKQFNISKIRTGMVVFHKVLGRV